MESLLAYSSDSDSDETEQKQRLEESEKKRKVTEMGQGSDVSGEKNDLQLVKRTKSCLQSSDERNVRNEIPDPKQNSCVIHQASNHEPRNMSGNFDVSHSLAPPGRNVKKNVPAVTSTVRGKLSIGSVSANSSNIKPYISKREKQKSIEPITSGASVNASIFPTEPQQRVAEFDFLSKQDEDRTSSETMSNKKLNYFNRPPKQVVVTFEGHSQGVNCVRWHPNRSNLLVSASMDHSVHVWDTSSGANCSKLMHHTAAVKDAKWNLDGSQVLSCGYDKTARLVNLETGQEVVRFPHHNYVTSVQFHPTDSKLFLAGTFKSSILCWDIRTGNITSTYSAFFGQVQDIAFLPQGNEFISAAEVIKRNSTDKGIMVWDFRSTAVLSNQIYQEAFTCTCLRVHPCESHFVAQSNGDYIALFSTRKPYKLNKFKRYEGHKVSGYHVGCDFSPDGSIICSGSADGQIYFYDHHSSRIISKLSGHSMPCMDVAFHPALPQCVASCGWDGGVKIWK